MTNLEDTVVAPEAYGKDSTSTVGGTTPGSEVSDTTLSETTASTPLTDPHSSAQDVTLDPSIVSKTNVGDEGNRAQGSPAKNLENDTGGNEEGKGGDGAENKVSFRSDTKYDEEEKQAESDAGSDDTLRRSAKESTKLIDEIRTLQAKLHQIERQTEGTLNFKRLEAEWDEAAKRLGTQQEKYHWEQMRKERMKLLMEDTVAYAHGKRWMSRIDDDFNERMEEERKWNEEMIGHRRAWERSRGPLRHRREYNPFDTLQSRNREFDNDNLGIDSDDSDQFPIREELASRKFERDLTQIFEERQRFERRRSIKQRQRRLGGRARSRAINRATGDASRSSSDSESQHTSVEDKDKTEEEVVEPDAPPQAEPRLNYVGWAQFKPTRGVFNGGSPSFIIDVLVGEPVIAYDVLEILRFRMGKNSRYGREQEKALERKPPTKQTLVAGQAPLPERIRINSKELLRIFARIHESELAGSGSEPVVIIRPFKALAYYDKSLRDWHGKLASKFDPPVPPSQNPAGDAGDGISPDLHADQVTAPDVVLHPAEGEDSPTASTSIKLQPTSETKYDGEEEKGEEREDEKEKDPNDDSTSATALAHLRCLLDFMDSHISTKTKYLHSSGCQRLSFADIWHLFKPGDTVIRSDGKQAYRVISITSTGHKVVPPWRNWFDQSSAEQEETPVKIKCVYVDFDGKQIGPVSKLFEIKRFEGERAVTSLDIYPLRFHPLRKDKPTKNNGKEGEPAEPGTQLQKHLVGRGKKFLQAAGIKHMYYVGPDLETKDDIESQVMIDFETAFSADDSEEKKKEWKPILETLLGATPEESKEKESCRAECCSGENIHDDAYVEKKRNEEYMASLFPESRDNLPSVAIVPRPLKETNTPGNVLTEDDLAIMSYRVFGFVLRNRKWGKFPSHDD